MLRGCERRASSSGNRDRVPASFICSNPGGFGDPAAHEDADEDDEDAEHERNPPAPGQQLGLGHETAEDHEDEVADQHADVDGGGEEAPPEPVPSAGVLKGQQGGPAPLAAGAESLQEPNGDEEDGRGDTDGLVAGQQADGGGRQTHDHEGDHEDTFAAEPVAVVSAEHTAEGPGDETRGIDGERQQCADGRALGREEQLREDQCRGCSVEEEVVPVDDRADRGGGDDAPHAGRVRHRVTP